MAAKYLDMLSKLSAISLNPISHNPKKSLREIINEIYYVQKRIIEAEDDGYKGKFLTKGNLDLILGNIEDGMKRLNYLMDQVENVNRRNK